MGWAQTVQLVKMWKLLEKKLCIYFGLVEHRIKKLFLTMKYVRSYILAYDLHFRWILKFHQIQATGQIWAQQLVTWAKSHLLKLSTKFISNWPCSCRQSSWGLFVLLLRFYGFTNIFNRNIKLPHLQLILLRLWWRLFKHSEMRKIDSFNGTNLKMKLWSARMVNHSCFNRFSTYRNSRQKSSRLNECKALIWIYLTKVRWLCTLRLQHGRYLNVPSAC